MGSNYHPFNDKNGNDSEPDIEINLPLDAAERQPETALHIGRRKMDTAPNPFRPGNAGVSNLLSLTKKKKRPPVPKIQSSGVVNYGCIGIDQNSDSESESVASTLSSGSIPQGYNLPFRLQTGFANNALQKSDNVDDDELSQRTPIPKAPTNPAINAILPSDFLRNRTNSETNISDISEDDSIVKRHKREEENVGRLVHAAKQQQSFAQAWFSAGVGQNALPPIPVKKKIPSNAPTGARANVKKTQIIDPKDSSGPIDLDSGEVWNATETSDQGEDNHSKRNWEIGSFNYGTTHSMPTKKRANKKMIQFGVPEDEDLTTYYIENKCLDRIVCTIGTTRCSFLAVIVVCIFTLLLAGGAISAGIYLSQQSDEIQPSRMPSSAPSISQQPSISLVPSSAPSDNPTMTPSLVPTSGPSAWPSSRPSLRPSAVPTEKPTLEPSSPPSSMPSSSPSKTPTSQPSSQPSISSQPSLQPSDQPSNCFSSVLYEPQGDIQFLPNGYNNDRRGHSVSLSADGTIMAVSAIRYPKSSGSVIIYEKISNNQGVQWNSKGQLITGEEDFGFNIELSNDGNTLVVGDPTENAGVARVYRFDDVLNNWVKLGEDIIENDSAVAGYAVAISADGLVIAVGDPDYNGGSGRVKVYEFDNSSQDWVVRGPSINGESSFGEFGFSVSLSLNGNIVACGAPRGGATIWNFSGSVRVLRWDPTTSRWNMLGQEIESFTELGAIWFGQKISLAEDETAPRIAISSVDSVVDNLDKSGRVSVWQYDANIFSWSQVGEDMVGTPRANQKFGSSVSIAGDGTHVAVGVPIFGKGSTYVYFWNGGAWDESDELNGNDFESGFGHSVDLSKDGNTLAVGASSQFWKGYSQVFMSNKDCEYI